MLRKPLLPIAMAFVLAVAATIFAARWMQQRIDLARHERSGTAAVVVVVSEIPFGERITADAIKLVDWPRDVRPQNSFDNPKAVVGKFTNQRLFPGDVVLAQRITDRSAGNELSMLVQPDHRAVTVRVNDVIGVAGFLLPGNRVDVLATRIGSGRRAETRTLLQNIKVLAVDQTAGSAEKNEPVIVRAVTLETLPEDAEALVAAIEEGSVRLVLRNPDDVALRPESVAAAPPPPTPAPAPAPVKSRAPARKAAPPPPPRETVTVIRQTHAADAEPVSGDQTP